MISADFLLYWNANGRGPHFHVVDGLNPYKKGRYDQRSTHYPENRSGYKKRGKNNR
ncbi:MULTISPECIES: HNH/endonuclease VII fold putative polymorphic toxin [Priestia]|uniref:HNH/endonuclease VII fold putative polymorphic toxin n=1 Tax=Priestia TaxID=2800373 RepID=UPI0013F46487|nr:hypothetical protein [Bacillus sp. S34]MBY0211002.1 hypothetical protein [Priestia aryabhattai]NGY86493.1 hypothetical protein [Priestia megaterium]NGY91117.1 hypothetical protein [Priestia megaterium]QSF35679.1 hypothetical protein ICR95_05715 [Priestia megaterium]